MASVGIRELKNNLSHYVREVMAGRRITITDRGTPVAELVPPRPASEPQSRYDELVDLGLIRPPLERGDPFADLPAMTLPRGTARKLIDEDREER